MVLIIYLSFKNLIIIVLIVNLCEPTTDLTLVFYPSGDLLGVSLINITVFCSHGGESEHTSGSLYSFNECTG